MKTTSDYINHLFKMFRFLYIAGDKVSCTFPLIQSAVK